MNQEIQYKFTTLTKELAEKYDSKCYVDYDMPDRIEAIKFYKDSTGLNIQYIGCSDSISYNHTDHDNYGDSGIDNTATLSYINIIESESTLLAEISLYKFYEILAIVQKEAELIKEREEHIKDLKKRLEIY